MPAVTTPDRLLGGDPNAINAVFTNKTDNAEMEPMDFIKLMVTQMQNQDFTSPMDNSQMITQMAQFSNMQMMQEMASFSKSGYAMSLVGKEVTASRFTVSGDLDSTTGVVQKVSLVDNEYVLYVDGKKYDLNQVMAVSGGSTSGGGGSMVKPEKYDIVAGEVTSSAITFKWPSPTEDPQTAAELKYSVYYSKEGPMDTVEAVEEKGTLIGAKEQVNHKEDTVIGLVPGTEYYLNVIVTDAAGKKSVYKPIKVTTKTIAEEKT